MSLRNVLLDDARDAQVAQAQRMREDETKETSTATGGTAAPSDATFVVISLNAVLTNERTLAVTPPVALADAGAGGNVTISHAVSGVIAGTYTKVTVDTLGHVTVGANLIPADLPVHTHGGALDGGSLVVGTTDTDATPGSVFFAGAAGAIQEDNTNFFWHDANDSLGLGNAVPGARLHVSATTATLPGLIVQTTDDDPTENLIELRDSVGNVLANFDTSGDLEMFHADANIRFGTGTAMQFRHDGANGIFQNNVGNFFITNTDPVRSVVFATNNITRMNINRHGEIDIFSGGTVRVPLTVQGFAGQTAALFQLQEAAGAAAVYVDSGHGRAGSTFDINVQGHDINFQVRASGVPDAFLVDGAAGQITLGALATGLVKATAGVLSIAAGTDVPAHDMLSLQHGDTLAAAVSRGSLIYGNATPAWAELVHPAAAGYALVTDATDVAWDQNPTFTGDWTWTSSTSAKPVLTLENTNADGSAPTVDFYKDSASPLAGDDLGAWDFFGNTSTGAKDRYAYFFVESLDVTNGATGGGMQFRVVMNGTERNLIDVAGFNGTPNEGEVVINQDGQDVDFRVESANQTHMLFVDAGADVIGIRSSTPAASAEGLHVPWITGDADDTAYFGSTNANNDQVAIRAESYSNNGLMCTTVTGNALVANSTGAGDIAVFLDGGAVAWQIEDGGNLKAYGGSVLELGSAGVALDADGDTTISAPTDDQIDFEVGGTDRFVITNTYANFATGLLFLNETANTNMTIGLTIDQAANDDEVLNFRSSVVGAVRSSVETGTYLTAKKFQGSSGGCRMDTFKDADGDGFGAFGIFAHLAEDANINKTTTSRAIIELYSFQTDGTDIVNTVADGNLLALRTFRGAANVTVAIWDEDGDYYYNGALNAYDHLDDPAMARDLQRVLTGRKHVHYNIDAMVEAGILHPSEHGVMVSHKKMTALQLGAHAQAYDHRRRLEARIKYLEQQLEKVQ